MEKGEGRFYQRLIFLLSAAFICYEIAIFREIQFQLTANLGWVTPFYFSSVLCLIGLGSLAANFLNKYSLQSLVKRALLDLVLLCYPSFILLNFAVKLAQPDYSRNVFYQPHLSADPANLLLTFTLIILLGYGCIFFLQGVTYAFLFSHARKENFLSKIYASDLVAGGIASIAAGFLSFYLSPSKLIIISAVLFFAAFFMARKLLGYPKAAVLWVFGLTMFFLGLEFRFDAAKLVESPAYVLQGNRVSIWTPYQKIDVTENENEICLFSDGWIYYTVPKPNQPFLNSDKMFLSLAARVSKDKSGKVAIVGTGLGRDVFILRTFEDLNYGKLHKALITAIELDAKIPQAAKGFPWLWEKYSSAKIIGGEGRYFLETTPESFDLIHYAYLDQYVKISNFAFPDASFLYTDSAIKCALKRLTPGGYFLIKRVVPDFLQRDTIQRLCATLRLAGISSDQVLIWMSNESIHVPGARLHALYALIKKTPFLTEESNAIQKIAVSAYLSSQSWSTKAIQAATDTYPFSIKADVSFMYQMKSLVKRSPVLGTVVIIGLLLLLLRLCTSLSMAHFFAMGLAFMLLESVLLLNSFLLIGNPSLSTGVALGVFLFSVGCGSLISERVERSKSFILLLPLITVIYSLSIPYFVGYSMAMPKITRIALFALMIIPCGLVMGTIFPISLRAFKTEKVTRLFFINMLGCGLAPFVYNMFFPLYGYHFFIALAFSLYLFNALVILFRKA